MQQTKPRLDRDARREVILDVAQEVFLEEGFAAASMSTIAARLGGSKGTLYNYFKSKDDLFSAYVERRCLWQQDEVFAVPDGETPSQALQRLGRAYLLHVMNDQNLRNFRVIAAEAERSPEIGRIFYEAGPKRGIERLSELLATMARDGIIDVDGAPLLAARDFFGILHNHYFKARLCNAVPEMTPQEIDAEAARAARVFLRAYGRRD
jgi:AcrR family transcriptional regulator